MQIYDLIIVGAGPAGITAAVYAARKKLNFLVISKDIGGQAAWSGDIENYTGYQFISGPELVAKFEEHLRKYKIILKENEEVFELKNENDLVEISTDKGNYISKTVVIASGKKSKELGVRGEKEFKNRGVTYCATCDGPLFAGKDVAVIGGGNSALDAVLQLIKIARKIYLINVSSQLQGDAIMIEKVSQGNLVTVLNNSQVTAISADNFVTGITVKTKQAEKFFPVQGVFIEIGLEPNSGFTRGIAKNKIGEIIVDCRSQTNVPGIFAAGDVTDVPEKQIIVACGEGAKAALGAFRYLNQKR